VWQIIGSSIIVILLTLSLADHGFISGVIVSLLTLSVADHGFILPHSR
jgi:hypothetical protein